MEHATAGSLEFVEAVDDVHLSLGAAGDEMNVQHFEIEPGATVPSHSHHHEQVGVIYGGALTFVLEDGSEVTVEAGDSYALAGDEVHGAENRGDEPVKGIDVFSPPRTDPDWAD